MKKSDLQSSSVSDEGGAKDSAVFVEPIVDETTASTGSPSRAVQAEAARARASQFMADRDFAQARKALEEADALEAPETASKSGPRNVLTALRWRLSRKQDAPSSKTETAGAEAAEEQGAVVLSPSGAVSEAVRVVNLYSKIAAAAGLLPGNILNFAAILAVQVTMVWRIANTFGQKDGKNRIRGSILSLLGSVVPTTLGHGIGIAVTAIPAIIAGTVLYFLVTPVLAYALTQAVGNTFVMHFESGGTLLTFNPKAFQEYFLKEFREAGGTLKTA